MRSGALDYQYMARALQLARRGLFTSHPNPRVGCVIVNNNRIVGEGFHARAGETHAEINALRAAGAAARGAMAYVTLEPCCHYGRTSPCTQALIKAGIQRLVAAMEDPNPRVAGQGFAALAAAGIKAHSGVMQGEAEILNRGFISRMQRGRPWIRVKLAMSLDGRTALASGESRWISGEAARFDVQCLRARSSAIMTGSGTVRADNPQLTVRLTAADLEINAPLSQPMRVILSTDLNIDSMARVLEPPGQSLIFTAAGAPAKFEQFQRRNVDVITVASNDAGLDLNEVMQSLAQREINEVQVEAGATLSGALVRQKLVDELVIYMAPVLLGDLARGLLHLPEIARMSDRLRLRVDARRMFGEDLRITATPIQGGN
jgi:diaminohydroxyphosphoribosylaminopyrimidine deaminase / 5-amino-6-(5-phosphoribosylamino)uracil reductase